MLLNKGFIVTEEEVKTDISLCSDKVQQMFIKIPLTVNTYDIDAAGHVNNIVYIRWLEDLRTKLFSRMCNFKEVFENGFYLVVISTAVKYKKQIKIFDNPTGIMEFAGYKHGIISFKSIIKLGEEISTSAEQKCIIMNLNINKMIPDKIIAQIVKQN